ncbi:hypothetical protein B0H16DRAFT_1469851 [Mycena metata]|uniref:Uncharacterized protein n=1 Tax=Mycena metata TaxID=1033252 RepID=A0AAD7MSG0_9AGAR|nr:hypothetical protein B0H16DRAFT_1469851 [Mycena metata]
MARAGGDLGEKKEKKGESEKGKKERAYLFALAGREARRAQQNTSTAPLESKIWDWNESSVRKDRKGVIKEGRKKGSGWRKKGGREDGGGGTGRCHNSSFLVSEQPRATDSPYPHPEMVVPAGAPVHLLLLTESGVRSARRCCKGHGLDGHNDMYTNAGRLQPSVSARAHQRCCRAAPSRRKTTANDPVSHRKRGTRVSQHRYAHPYRPTTSRTIDRGRASADTSAAADNNPGLVSRRFSARPDMHTRAPIRNLHNKRARPNLHQSPPLLTDPLPRCPLFPFAAPDPDPDPIPVCTPHRPATQMLTARKMRNAMHHRKLVAVPTPKPCYPTSTACEQVWHKRRAPPLLQARLRPAQG